MVSFPSHDTLRETKPSIFVKLSNEILAMILSLLIHLVYEFVFPTFVFDEFSKVDNLIIGNSFMKSIIL